MDKGGVLGAFLRCDQMRRQTAEGQTLLRKRRSMVGKQRCQKKERWGFTYHDKLAELEYLGEFIAHAEEKEVTSWNIV